MIQKVGVHTNFSENILETCTTSITNIIFFTFQIFVEGMFKYLNLSREVVERIFPCIDKMIDIHFPFLEELRIRQNEQPVVSTISDILYRQFSGK